MKAEFMKRRFIISVVILGIVGFGIAFGGDVIVKEGSEYIANKLGIGTTSPSVALEVSDGEVIIEGADVTGGSSDAIDALVVVGGDGLDGTTSAGTRGSDISLTSGNGGSASTASPGLGGDIVLTGGEGGEKDYFSGSGGKGGDIIITSGEGGIGGFGSASGGDSGTIELTPGTPGTGSGSNGSYGNVLLAKNGGNVGIGTDSPSETLDVDGTVTMTGLIIPSGTTPAPNTEGALFLDTDAGTNGTLKIYSNGAWRTVAEL